MSENFKYPKLLHLYWDGSPLSYLNYLTVVSFNKHNKNWKINIYTPVKRTLKKSWSGFENKLEYNERCYFNELNNIKNVTISQIDFDEIGFDNDISEVIKSDYLRYYLLDKYGGVWSDFDIIYTGNICSKLNFEEDTIIFKKGIDYYPIGFFVSMPGCNFFKFILEQAKMNYNKDEYQSIGADLFIQLFVRNNMNINHIQESLRICDISYYLPFEWDQLDQFLVEKENTLPDNCIGLHWFNGASPSKQYAIELEKRKYNNFEVRCYLDKLIYEYIIMKLSILVPTVPSRLDFFYPRIIKTLLKQVEKHDNVEIIGLFDNKKRTVGEKRQNLLDLAKGEYLVFIDDDDRISEDYIDSILETLNNNPNTDCVVFDCITVVNNSNKETFCKYGIEFDKAHYINDDKTQWRGKPAHTMVYKSSIAKKHIFNTMKNCEEDIDWVNRACLDIKDQSRIDKVLYYYDANYKSTSETAGLSDETIMMNVNKILGKKT